MTTPDDETMWQANPWHKMYPQRYEEAVAEAAGALAGTCMGMGEDGPQWTDPFHKGFRAAVAVAFDRGFESARREDHDCVAVAEAEACGYQRAIGALRREADRLNPSTAAAAEERNLTMWAVYAAAADRLAALVEGAQP